MSEITGTKKIRYPYRNSEDAVKKKVEKKVTVIIFAFVTVTFALHHNVLK